MITPNFSRFINLRSYRQAPNNMDTYSMLLFTDSRFKTIKPHIDFVIKQDALPFDITIEAKNGAVPITSS